MKYFKFKHIALFLSLLTLSGCDFMNCDESSDYTKSDIFESYTRTKQMVIHLYAYLPTDFCQTEGAMLDAATDDAIHVYESSNIQRFVNGTWSANYTANDVWHSYYAGIRAANLYLKEAEGLDFKEWEFADDYESIIKEFTNYQYEVRFLRAFFYFELIKRYNNIPFIDTVLTPEEANVVQPSTFGKIADFIVDECTKIALQLPINYDGFASKETGRITKGAALALKARVALYAASPLFSPANDQKKWEAAAEASHEIISNASQLGYRLDKYTNLFNATNNTSAEVILSRPIGESGDFEKDNFPMGVEQGRTSTCPTQNLMEAYEMKTGEPFNWEDPKVQANPYINRDPRLNHTIVVNDTKWPGSNNIEIWEGGANGLPLNSATKTGYYLKKYVNNEISFAPGSKVTKKHHNWILFRYAEVLLNYAEAMVNAFDDPDFKNNEFTMSAIEAVNMVRAREGINMPALPTSISSDEFIKRLKNERRVELAFEGHRFWDVRRWKELNVTSQIYGMKIEKAMDGFNYSKFLYATRKITDNMYFYPISNIELYKNENLKQNTGW